MASQQQWHISQRNGRFFGHKRPKNCRAFQQHCELERKARSKIPQADFGQTEQQTSSLLGAIQLRNMQREWEGGRNQENLFHLIIQFNPFVVPKTHNLCVFKIAQRDLVPIEWYRQIGIQVKHYGPLRQHHGYCSCVVQKVKLVCFDG